MLEVLCRCGPQQTVVQVQEGALIMMHVTAQQVQQSGAGGSLTSTIAVVTEVQPRTSLMPVDVVPGVVAAPAAPHLVLSAWIFVSEPTSSVPKVKALPTCRQLQEYESEKADFSWGRTMLV